MLRVEGLSKRYGNLWAARDVHLQVGRGEVFALLGPNGAGKSTVIKAVVGLVRPSAGKLYIRGVDAMRYPELAKAYVGYFPQRLSLYPGLTVEETLQFFALARGLPADAVDAAVALFGLGDVLGRRVGSLSGGTQQRVGLAQTFMGDPDLLVLDEPTSSLDPVVAGELKRYLRTLRGAGKSILLASHVLSEVQELADRVGIMLEGRLVAVGTPWELGARLRLASQIHLVLMQPSEGAVYLARRLGALSAELSDSTLIVRVDPSYKLSFLTSMAQSGIGILDFHVQDPSLEEVFLRYAVDDS